MLEVMVLTIFKIFIKQPFTHSIFCFHPSGKLHKDYSFSCPVALCKGVQFKIRKDFKRHWKEQHEELIENHICAICGYSTKRKYNLVGHVKQKHMFTNPKEGIGPIQYHENRSFINPYPFTKEMLFESS